MPAPSDAETNRCLDRVVSDGGSWWVGASSTVPELVSGALTNVTDVGIALVELPRDGATSWEAAASRRVQPLAGVSWAGVASAFLPVARVFWDGSDALTANPVRWARLGSTPEVPVGGTFFLPPESLALADPA